MLKLQWNALRVGDQVAVHESRGLDVAPVSGIVAVVDCRKGSNGVGIRVTTSDEERTIVWPARLAVHTVPGNPTEVCWRCDDLDGRTDLPDQMNPLP